MGQYVSVGAAEWLTEGEIIAYQVSSRRICIARVEDVFYAFDDVCTHAACSLADGNIEGDTVVCPCHYGQFDLATGTVIDGPPPAPIRVYPVREVDGQLQIEV